MSQENVEIVRAVYALGLDPEVLERAFDEYLTADFELRPPEDYPDAETYRGLEGLRSWRRMIDETWNEWRFEPRRFYDAGDRVAVRVRIVAQGGASGVPLDRETGHVWSIRDGRVASARVYLDPADALEAVGISE